MKYHLTLKSTNAKTGPIPVSTQSAETCPPACPMRGKECYARFGPLLLHWSAVTRGERGVEWKEFVQQIASLPPGQAWRYGQAGDLPGRGNLVDAKALGELVRANAGKRGWAYTHKPLTPSNAAAIQSANEGGFRVNLSADSLSEADELAESGVGPVVVVLPDAKPATTPSGRRVIVCPAETHGVSCSECMLCQKARSVIVGFPAHGTAAKSLSLKLQSR